MRHAHDRGWRKRRRVEQAGCSEHGSRGGVVPRVGLQFSGWGKEQQGAQKRDFPLFFSPVSFLNSQTLEVMRQEGTGRGRGGSTEIRSVKNFPSSIYFFLLLFSLVHSIPSLFPLPKYPTWQVSTLPTNFFLVQRKVLQGGKVYVNRSWPQKTIRNAPTCLKTILSLHQTHQPVVYLYTVLGNDLGFVCQVQTLLLWPTVLLSVVGMFELCDQGRPLTQTEPKRVSFLGS